MGTSAEGLATMAEAVTSQASESFTRAAELSTAVRVLLWFKETGDYVRNKDRFTPAQLSQRKMILNAAHAVLKAERDEALETFFNNLNYRDKVALRELQETLDGNFE